MRTIDRLKVMALASVTKSGEISVKKGCCRCEIVVYSLPYEMSRRPQKSSIVIYK